jgi:hypothetical protein
MTKSKSLGIAFLLTITIQAAWTQNGPMLWNSAGVAIRQGFHIEWYRAAEKTADGGIVYAWSDTRSGDRDVYAQRVNTSGAKLWGDEGALIVAAPGRQEDPALIPTSDGNFILIWNDFRNDTATGDLYTQKIDSGGNIQWDSSGILLSDSANFDSPAVFRIVADTVGGAVILWNDLRNGNSGDIYGIRVTSDGNRAPEWPENGLGVKVSSGGQRSLTVDTDNQGGALVGWTDDLSPSQTLDDIYIQRVTMDGQIAWNPYGVAVCDTNEHQSTPKLCPDGSGGAYITWLDKRSDTEGDLYFQHVLSDGTMGLPETQGRPLIALAAGQVQQRIVADGSGNAIVIWLDTRNNPLTNDIYAQKIDASGNLLWNAQGMPVCTESAIPVNQRQARLNANGVGDAIIVWENEDGNNIFAQKLNSSGNTVWTAPDAGGVSVCEAAGLQEFPLVRATPDRSYIGWADERSGSRGIWHQILNDLNGAPQQTVDGDTLIWGISGNSQYPKLVADGQGNTFVFFQDQRDGTAGSGAFVQILNNAQGQIQLDANGKRICPDPAFTTVKGQEAIDACGDGGTGAIVAWEDHRDSNTAAAQIYAQRVGSDGSLLWGTTGVQVSEYIRQQNEPLIVEDGVGGGVIVWSEHIFNYRYRTRAARISHDGVIQWDTIIIDTDTLDEVLEDIAPDSNGGAYISWQTGEWPNFNLGAQWVDGTGTLGWGTSWIDICTAPDGQLNCRAIGLGAEGAIFIWEDERDGAKDIYAQKIDASGNALWEADGRLICSAANDQSAIDWAFDGQGNVFIIWKDFRGGLNSDLYMQKMSFSGDLLFPANGLLFCGASGDQASPYIIGDGLGGSHTFWGDFRAVPSSDIYGVHLDGNGDLTTEFGWVQNGNIVNAAFQKQTNPVAIDDTENGAVVVWEDKRSSGKQEVINLYAQSINGYNVGIHSRTNPEATPSEFRLNAPYPNPFNPDVTLSIEMQRPANIRLAVYDLMGRLVEVLTEGKHQAGFEEITWQVDELSSGMYVVRLEVENQNYQQKLILLK